MGVGKSTTAELLAAQLRERTGFDWALRDSDVDLQALVGVQGDVIAAQYGVGELHRLESAVLLGALAVGVPTVISAAASVVEDARCREALARRAFVTVLELPLDALPERIAAGDHRREIDPQAMRDLAKRRSPLFQEVADMVVSAELSTDEIVADIMAASILESSTNQ